jgi:N-hydroxyarylamine O-acetyltransferase
MNLSIISRFSFPQAHFTRPPVSKTASLKNSVSKKAYLDRIGYHGALPANIHVLRSLHRAHLLTVPFENLDIHLGRPILLDEARLFDKIIRQGRGGFCYELNGLFSALLRSLGFTVHRLSARVANGSGGFGIPFDHMALLVELNERWLADVGFGDSFREPLRLDDRGEQVQESGRYRIDEGGDSLVLYREEDGAWKPQYTFSPQACELASFEKACRYHQTSPESSFTRRQVCTLARPQGRVTLSDRKLILTENGVRQEKELESESEVYSALREHFGIDLFETANARR